MNKLFMAIGQITVGVIVGNAASSVLNKGVVEPLKKVIENSKKKES